MGAQILRPYQSEALNKVRSAFARGNRKVLLVSPAGSGKTTVFCDEARRYAQQGLRVLINVHRRELATQAATRLREFGVPHGLIMSGEMPNLSARVQIASVQTLVRRDAPPADLVINDEAHLSTASTWFKILDQYASANILGVSASPWRLGGKPLAGFYDDVVIASTPAELRAQGFLCPYVGFSFKAPDMTGVKTTGGDFNERQTAERMRDPQLVDNIVEQYQQHASKLSAVVFAVTVEHSLELCRKFREAGVTAEHVDGSTGTETRNAILKRVESGATMVLCNVGVAVEGLDIPRLKCCILARPTKSLARYIQMVGRVRRPWNGVTARIHDHSFNIRLHGLPDAERDYSLDAKPEKPPSLTMCPECFAYDECMCEVAKVEIGERTIETVDDAEQFTFTSEDSFLEEGDVLPAESLPPVVVKWNAPGKREYVGKLVKRWDEKTEYGPRRMYELRGTARLYHLPGTTDLNSAMAQIANGAFVYVQHTEDRNLGNGKVKKIFRVEIDE